jgi:hypothetical protein
MLLQTNAQFSSNTNYYELLDSGAAEPVGPDRWAGRESKLGAPSGRALPALVQLQSAIGITWGLARWRQFQVSKMSIRCREATTT